LAIQDKSNTLKEYYKLKGMKLKNERK